MRHEKNRQYYIKKASIHLLQYLNIQTVLFNFKYFQFSEALLLPVYVSTHTSLSCLKGSIEIKEKIRPGMITIGYGGVPIFDKKRSRAAWNVKGKVVFKG